ncbi:MAG: WYL domain-containing protein [Bacteroides sp.]|nr:WYL domain-containing protein [Bacillota bacterium]MCM1393377.1 WYL domain-containing protein [[Eubacterium] siraeum]MCM1455525.1 WYL domain-containing protein [Bacteroides sp.]
MAIEAKKTLIMRIYQILENYSDEEHPLKQQDIIELLYRDYGIECERKAVGRNVSYLKEMGYDIESDARGAYLASRRFENAELRLLIDSVLGSRHINSVHSKQLIDKLIALGGRNFKNIVKHVHTLNDWEKSQNKDFFLNIEIADEAIEKGKKIAFDYNRTGVDGKLHVTDTHIASPYQMILHNQRYYLMLKDDKYDSVSYDRLDKITDMHILDEDALPLKENEGFKRGINYNDIATGMPYMFSDAPVSVTLKCKNFMMDELVDWFGHGFTAKNAGDGYFTAKLKASPRAMLYWVLQYNDKVEVLSPASLRDEVIATLKSALSLYE